MPISIPIFMRRSLLTSFFLSIFMFCIFFLPFLRFVFFFIFKAKITFKEERFAILLQLMRTKHRTNFLFYVLYFLFFLPIFTFYIYFYILSLR
jgi:hypothetical protein